MNRPTVQPLAFSRVRVRYLGPDGPVDRTFEGSFRIGRDAVCELTLVNGYVSRSHVEVNYQDGQWVAKDLNSSNGMYAGGERVQSVGNPLGPARARVDSSR
jgi:pSer/pThr/pTyr-binding forkhead associated (FHA) protein